MESINLDLSTETLVYVNRLYINVLKEVTAATLTKVRGVKGLPFIDREP